MKSILLALLVLATGNFAVAQYRHREAPAQVRESFQRDFPGVSSVQWSVSGNQWSASFTDRSAEDRGEMVAHYDRNGRHMDSYVPYARNDVPQPVYNSARNRYHNDNVQFTWVEHPRRGDYFRVRGRVKGRMRTSYYDENGRERHYDDSHWER